MADWAKLIFIGENKCEYRNVLGNVDIWRVPVLPKPTQEGLGTSKIETYYRRKITVEGTQLDVFCLDGLSEKEILTRIQLFTNQPDQQK
jgi:hypothetical protein